MNPTNTPFSVQTQTTWWWKIFAAAVHFEVAFVGRLWRKTFCEEMRKRVLTSLWRDWSTVQDNYSISAGEHVGRAFMVFGLLNWGVRKFNGNTDSLHIHLFGTSSLWDWHRPARGTCLFINLSLSAHSNACYWQSNFDAGFLLRMRLKGHQYCTSTRGERGERKAQFRKSD